ncbi:serine/threonine-protein kinase [Streptomyces gobiensis]|uniref:serine/threonine-protein kinase n=1 Tax=Streptomyces gobiensis TaxID=2875706 RepID=UPI001E288869|nr:serine/threonine-protein kinase [Streptomyces gobiensis]UGY90862.1 serine/threonine protein kinase [Streptomyces gobiensis]
MTGGTSGQIIDGRFELLERLASGGMGTVWRARDIALQREVALKEVRPPDPVMVPEGSEASRMLRERVMREAQALARLSHPNVVTIYHIIDQDPHPWLVMELLPGHTLQDQIAQGPLSPQEAARVGRDVLAALRAAHGAGIHHRDVKPANVLLRADGSAVLTDFGIAALQGSTSLTATGDLIGSPEYIAPERIRDAGDHPAADLWSLGMMLYAAVEGHSPMRRGTTLATLAAVLDEPIPPPVRSGPLTPVLNALLVRDPAARPDAGRLDRMLAEAANAPSAPVPYSPTQLDAARSAAAPTQPARTAPSERGGHRTVLFIGVITGAVALLGGLIGGGLLLAGKTGGSSTPAKPTEPTKPTNPTEPTPTEKGTGRERETETESPPGEQHARTWIAQLFSEPVSSGTAARDRRLAAVRKSVPEAQLLRSDDFASLNPGYWVIYAPGPFADGKAAVSFCGQRGRTTANTCVGRYLSHDAADKVYICHPKAGGTGRCTRS